jgi:hypothetical protein
VAHGGTCSTRDLEQVVCYSNDLIDSLKGFYVSKNSQRVFNVPTIIRVVDNLGNDDHVPQERGLVPYYVLGANDSDRRDLQVGQILNVEIEVDPTFDPTSYVVTWQHRLIEIGRGALLNIPITISHVGETCLFECYVTSSKDWHRYGHWDDQLSLIYRVLPPV